MSKRVQKDNYNKLFVQNDQDLGCFAEDFSQADSQSVISQSPQQPASLFQNVSVQNHQSLPDVNQIPGMSPFGSIGLPGMSPMHFNSAMQSPVTQPNQDMPPSSPHGLPLNNFPNPLMNMDITEEQLTQLLNQMNLTLNNMTPNSQQNSPQVNINTDLNQSFNSLNVSSMLLPLNPAMSSGFLDSSQHSFSTKNLSTHHSSRFNEFMKIPITEILANIDKITSDQSECRMLQDRIPKETQEFFDELFDVLIQKFQIYAQDQFANYLCQKLFERVFPDQLEEIVVQILPKIISFSKSSHATRVVQRMIEKVHDPKLIEQIIFSLKGSIAELAVDQNGNHVVQKCLGNFDFDQNQFIFEELCSSMEKVGVHKHGCCVLQRCCDNSDEKQKMMLYDAAIEMILVLVQDAYGNYVVQHLLQLPDFTDKKEIIISHLCDNIVYLSKQKYSSNVIDKCIQSNYLSLMKKIGQTLESDENQLVDLLTHQFANYVVQKFLVHCEDQQTKRAITALIELNYQIIKERDLGVKVLQKLNREIGLADPNPSANSKNSYSNFQKNSKYDQAGHQGGPPNKKHYNNNGNNRNQQKYNYFNQGHPQNQQNLAQEIQNNQNFNQGNFNPNFNKNKRNNNYFQKGNKEPTHMYFNKFKNNPQNQNNHPHHTKGYRFNNVQQNDPSNMQINQGSQLAANGFGQVSQIPSLPQAASQQGLPGQYGQPLMNFNVQPDLQGNSGFNNQNVSGIQGIQGIQNQMPIQNGPILPNNLPQMPVQGLQNANRNMMGNQPVLMNQGIGMLNQAPPGAQIYHHLNQNQGQIQAPPGFGVGVGNQVQQMRSQQQPKNPMSHFDEQQGAGPYPPPEYNYFSQAQNKLQPQLQQQYQPQNNQKQQTINDLPQYSYTPTTNQQAPNYSERFHPQQAQQLQQDQQHPQGGNPLFYKQNQPVSMNLNLNVNLNYPMGYSSRKITEGSIDLSGPVLKDNNESRQSKE